MTGVQVKPSGELSRLPLPAATNSDRLLAGNEMCSHKVNVTNVDQIDDELLGWLRAAYDRA